MPSISYFADFATQTVVTHVVNTALSAGVNAVMVPTQMVLAVGTAAASSIATYLIMTTAKLTLTGAAYVGTQTYNGITYFFYRPEEKAKSEAFDNCDVELTIVSSNSPRTPLSDN